VLSQAECSYNNFISQTIEKCPFEVVYGQRPLSLLDFSLLPTLKDCSSKANEHVEQIKKFHEDVRQTILRQNAQCQNQVNKYKILVIFKERDLVWVHLRKK